MLKYIKYNVFLVCVIMEVSTISESKSYPVSAYLSPRAYFVLKKFHEGSLLGSMSRTVEEIILSFRDIYGLAKVAQKALLEGNVSPENKDWFVNQVITLATTRLSLGEYWPPSQK